MSEPLMPRLAHIIKKNPGNDSRRAGAKGLWVGLNNNVIPHFTGRAQVV
jgi:hypothetical protein